MKHQFSPKKIARPFLILTLLATACGAIAADNSQQEKKTTSEDIGKGNSVTSATEAPISKALPELGPQFAPADPVYQIPAPLVYSPMAQKQTPFIGPYTNQDIMKLESRPGSPYVLFLDIWDIMEADENGLPTIPKNGRTQEEIYRMWQIVTGFYSAFNLNITTNFEAYNKARVANVKRTGVHKFLDADGTSNSDEGIFGLEYKSGYQYTVTRLFYPWEYAIGITAAHEIGHIFGLSHDGATDDGEYYLGKTYFQWATIMGSYWYMGPKANAVFQFSKGEYALARMPGGKPQQDDLAIISSQVPYMIDDNPAGKALAISNNFTILPAKNYGLIEKTGDSDDFTFTVGANGAMLNLDIDRIELLGMLDVDAKIINNATGAVVSASNPDASRKANFKNLGLMPGNYSLRISGGAEGTPLRGFSNYSSLGYYAMSGSLVPNGSSPLTSGQALNGITLAAAETRLYTIDVPTGKTSLIVKLTGPGGDADIFAKRGSVPTATVNDGMSAGFTSKEAFTINAPVAGTYYVLLKANEFSTGMTLIATVQ